MAEQGPGERPTGQTEPLSAINGMGEGEASPGTPSNRTVSVFSGYALTAEEGNALAAAMRTRVIACVGPIRSGKTTLIAALYEAFRKGKFGGYRFAGSRTLLGFEERCHLSRGASEKDEPDTERTKSDAEDILLHLRVQPETLEEVGSINLIFCDLSGELFEAAGESSAALLRIPYLSQAHHVAMFIDGAKLIDDIERHAAKQDFLTLIRAGIESSRFNSATSIEVVFSKQDLILDSSNRQEVEEFQIGIKDACTRFARELRSLTFHRVASRPEPDEGLTILFRNWAEQRPLAYEPLVPNLSATTRQIDAFGAKIGKAVEGAPHD